MEEKKSWYTDSESFIAGENCAVRVLRNSGHTSDGGRLTFSTALRSRAVCYMITTRDMLIKPGTERHALIIFMTKSRLRA